MSDLAKRRRDAGYSKKAYARIKADPERWTAYLAKKREWQRVHSKEQSEKTKLWKENNKDSVKKHKQKDYNKNKEKYRAKNKTAYNSKREEIKAKIRQNRILRHDEIIARERERRRTNPEYFKKMRDDHRKKNPAAWRLYRARRAAKNAGVDFDLDRDWFEVRLAAGVCEMSGLPFDLREKIGLGGRGPNSASVDRKDPSGGYTKANCRMVLWWINRAMVNLGEDYALNVFRSIFVKRGEILEYDDRMAA